MNDSKVCMNNQAVSQEVIEGEAIGVKDESNKADNHSSSTEGKDITIKNQKGSKITNKALCMQS